MNCRREHRKEVYNNQYKKYLSLMKKTSVQRARNRLLQCTNGELSKENIRLKEEIRKVLQINSNLKAEINDLTKDEKHLMDDNKGLYNTLTTIHNDTVAFEKMISHFLNSLDPEIKSCENQNRFSMTNVNGQVINNSKDILQLPETNYQRYNFKDIIYIQDLSPIMEENAEVKQLIKPSDITRRLGHRAIVPHPDKYSENGGVKRSVLDEGAETNIVSCSPSSARDFQKEIKELGKQSVIVEEVTIPNIGVYSAKELLSSPSGCNESNNMTADEPVLSSTLPNHSESHHTTTFKDENDGVSPLLTINVVPPSDNENTLHEKDFHSSLFANVFPRRRMINSGSSLSLGSVEEGNEEPNSTDIEKENLSPRVSTNSLKNDLDQSTIKLKSDSFVKPNLTISCENNSGLTSEISHQEESIIENTCSDFQHDFETITTDGNARNKSNVEILSESMEEESSEKSSLDITSKSVKEKKSGDKPLSRTADRNSVKSSKCPSPGRTPLEDSKKSLRPKKPLKFAESPVVKMNQKRKRKLEKAVK